MEAADATAWPFAAGGDVAERWEWLTDGLPPPTGMEQTRQLREAPRIALQFEGLQSGRHRRRMETLLVMNTAGRWHAPLAMDTTETTAEGASAATTLSLDTADRRFRDGGNAIVVDRDDPSVYEVLEIATVGAGVLNLSVALAATWPAGSKVMPTVGATLESALNLARFTGDDVPYAVAFRTAEALAQDGDFGAATYRSLPVLEWSPDWSTDPVFTPARNVVEVDYGLADPVRWDAAGVVLPQTTVDVAAITQAEVAELRGLLYALSGRWQPIWVSSYGQDVLVESLTGSATLDVERMGLCDWPLQANRRDLRFLMRDGTVFYRRITSAAAVDADTERWVLDSDLPVGFSAANVACASFMALCRQTSDTNLLRLWSRGVVTTQLSFQGCAHEL